MAKKKEAETKFVALRPIPIGPGETAAPGTVLNLNRKQLAHWIEHGFAGTEGDFAKLSEGSEPVEPVPTGDDAPGDTAGKGTEPAANPDAGKSAF